MTYRLLIADDDAKLTSVCVGKLKKAGSDLQTETVLTPEGCLAKIRGTAFDAVILDINFSKSQREGIALIPEIIRLAPDCEILMMSSLDDDETVHACLQAGAHEFISKQENTAENLDAYIEGALARKASRKERATIGADLARSVRAAYASPAMAKVYSRVAAVRNSPTMHVLITGPSGAGKEMVARALARPDAPFISINCARISETLGDSELFGHEKGSYTSADRQRLGAFERASGGDIFLDEVARLSLFAQAQLLRVLQSGEYSRIGGDKTFWTTARIIAATNEDLDRLVADGKFREDLLRRLRRFSIVIPPLAERPEDIDPIVRLVIKRSPKPHLRVEPRVMRAICSYSWPGNVRQLEDTLNEAILFAEGAQVTIADMPEWFWPAKVADATRAPAPPGSHVERYLDHALVDAERLIFLDIVKATLRRLPSPVTLAKLASVLQADNSTLSRRIQECGYSWSTLLESLTSDVISAV